MPRTFAESISIVLDKAIVPPPDKPLPATIDTPLCATCSSATNPDKLSCTIWPSLDVITPVVEL